MLSLFSQASNLHQSARKQFKLLPYQFRYRRISRKFFSKLLKISKTFQLNDFLLNFPHAFEAKSFRWNQIEDHSNGTLGLLSLWDDKLILDSSLNRLSEIGGCHEKTYFINE
jgi:hypothetical protein